MKINNEYLRLDQRKDLPFIKMDNGDKIYVDYVDNKFKPTKVDGYNGFVSSSTNEVVKDFQINSLKGLDVWENIALNDAWFLRGVNIKNKNFSKANAAGSIIDVAFTMQYNKSNSKSYIEIPALQ